MKFVIGSGGTLGGKIRVPGDKSISHRAVMFSALADGTSDIDGFLNGEDCLCTLRAFQQMGVNAVSISDTQLQVKGVGLHGLSAPGKELYLGNSGTSMRLMSGILAGQAFASTLNGDESLSKRPMKRVIDPLLTMGARIGSVDGKSPLTITPAGSLKAIQYHSPVSSAQVKSCVLLAGLYAQGKTEVFEPHPSRDHTEKMLQSLGVNVDSKAGYAALTGGQSLKAGTISVPADISSAAFFMVGALIAKTDVTLTDVGVNPTRTGIIDILRKMGAEIQIENPRLFGAEPVADIVVKGSASDLRAIEIGADLVALAIDEFPALFVLAATINGTTVISGAEELRVKESDRIQTMADGLKILGVDIKEKPDGALITGVTGRKFSAGNVDSHGDHRVAMSFAMAGLYADGEIRIGNCDNVNTSFPGFAHLAKNAGLHIDVIR